MVAARPAGPSSPHSRLAGSAAVRACCVGVFVLLGIAIYWPVEPFSSSRIVDCGCFDPAQQTWFLAWTPHAISRLGNPFFSTGLDYPRGVNLAANTLMPLLGLIGWPVTATLGPVATLNVLLRLAFATSATSMFLVLCRFVRNWPAAFVGALCYGFSPYLVAQGSLHLDLAFVPLPPLIVVTCYRLVTGRGSSPRRSGALLGALCAAQYLVDAELLADLVLLLAVGLVLAALRDPRALPTGGRRLLEGGSFALGLFLAACGYPLWMQLAGPQHLPDARQALGGLVAYDQDLLSPVVPTTTMLLAPARLAALGSRLVGGNLPEAGGYLGVPLLIVTGALGLAARRRRPVGLAAALAVVAFVMSLGPRLTVDGRLSAIRLPFDLLWGLPLTSSEVPARYSCYVVLFAAVVLALGLDEALLAAAGRGRARLRQGAVLALGAVALVPLVPRLPYLQPPTGAPNAFLDSAAAASIPPGAVVLTYPYPAPPEDNAMLWDAELGDRWDLLGGYAITPKPGDVMTPPALLPRAMVELLTAAYTRRGEGLDVPRAAERRALSAFVLDYDVGAIVLDPVGADPDRALVALTLTFGPPRLLDGVALWLHPRPRRE